MKKISSKKIEYFAKKQHREFRWQSRQAGYKRAAEYKKKHSRPFCPIESPYLSLVKNRGEFKKRFYKPLKYDRPKQDVVIKEQLGIEHDFGKFVELASTFVNSRSKWITFDLKNCERLWPSAITLLCSLKQWTDITAHPHHVPSLGSTDSYSDEVNAYLVHSGFCEYVRMDHDDFDPSLFSDDSTVKITRENNTSEIGIREDEIYEIIERYSGLDPDQMEEFNSVVLVEVFNNVSEHGISSGDSGWWTLTQYHPRTGIISLCIADNGIGIKHSLKTGPQQAQLEEAVGQNATDGDYIKAALDENISGALRASQKSEAAFKVLGTKIGKAYTRGSRRGNGLNRIKDTCKKCGVEFSLLSQRGYLNMKPDGTTGHSGTAKSKIFSGTLYHFSIPTKTLHLQENNYASP